MKLNELKPSVPRKSRKRVGRGESSGWGKTAGKGSNGQNSRAGGGVKPYFEGGQMPIYRRTPKRGFSNALFRKDYVVLNLSDLNRFEDGTVVTPELLKEQGIVKNMLSGVKILGNGKLEKKVSLKVHQISASAKSAVEANGGSVELIKIARFVNAEKNN